MNEIDKTIVIIHDFIAFFLKSHQAPKNIIIKCKNIFIFYRGGCPPPHPSNGPVSCGKKLLLDTPSCKPTVFPVPSKLVSIFNTLDSFTPTGLLIHLVCRPCCVLGAAAVLRDGEILAQDSWEIQHQRSTYTVRKLAVQTNLVKGKLSVVPDKPVQSA